MKKAESYYLKDGKLDLSLLNEEVTREFKPITYHTIKTVSESAIKGNEQGVNLKEKLYGSLETYEVLKEMGEYLLGSFNIEDSYSGEIQERDEDGEYPEGTVERETQQVYEEENQESEVFEPTYEVEVETEEVSPVEEKHHDEVLEWTYEVEVETEEVSPVEENEESEALEWTYEVEVETKEVSPVEENKESEALEWTYEEEDEAEEQLGYIHEEDDEVEWTYTGEHQEYPTETVTFAGEELLEDKLDQPEDTLEWTYEAEGLGEDSEEQAQVEHAPLQYHEILTYQVSPEDQVLMKQYEKPDDILELEEERHKKKHSKIQEFREYQIKLLQGRILTQDIVSQKGVLIGKAGERITADLLERAKEEGALIKIILKYL